MPELTNSGPQLLSRPAASALEQSIADSVEAVGRQSDVDEALSGVPGDKEAQRPCSHSSPHALWRCPLADGGYGPVSSGGAHL